MKPTQLLSKEHENILKLTRAIIKKCEVAGSKKDLDKNFFEKSIDFIQNYADKFHHAKEENILFVEGEKCQAAMHCGPVSGPIHQMLHEHNESRELIKKAEEGLKENNKSKVVKNMHDYAKLLEIHIFKEDNILYPILEESLNKKTDESILKKFKIQEEGTKISEEKYLGILKELTKN